MEQWRIQESKRRKLVLLMISAFALGGCGIWCMHFTGMGALAMTLDDGSVLEVDFEGGMTILSLIFPVLGVFVGLKIASEDPFFLEMEQSRRKEILAQDLQKMTLESMMKRGQVARKLKFIALFSRLWRIGIGGFFAALGVLGMHYLGMIAQRTNASLHFNAGVIVLSSVVAFVTANAAFWILFRAVCFFLYLFCVRATASP
jgi:NO-binding membrane sensor protein with MHYT domain